VRVRFSPLVLKFTGLNWLRSTGSYESQSKGSPAQISIVWKKGEKVAGI